GSWSLGFVRDRQKLCRQISIARLVASGRQIHIQGLVRRYGCYNGLPSGLIPGQRTTRGQAAPPAWCRSNARFILALRLYLTSIHSRINQTARCKPAPLTPLCPAIHGGPLSQMIGNYYLSY